MNGVGGSNRWIAIMAHRFLPEIYTVDAYRLYPLDIIMCFAVGVYVSPHNYSTYNHFLVHRLKEILKFPWFVRGMQFCNCMTCMHVSTGSHISLLNDRQLHVMKSVKIL